MLDIFIKLLVGPLGKIGLLLIAGAFLFSAVWTMLPESIQVKAIDSLMGKGTWQATGFYPGVEAEAITNIVDLTEWGSRSKQGCCKVTWDTEILVRRVRDDANYYVRRVATTGDMPNFTSKTHPIEFVEVNEQRVAGPVMKRYDVMLDISTEELYEPFPLHLRTARFNSFSDPSHEWLSYAVTQAARKLEILVRFPIDKTGNNYKFTYSSRLQGRNYQPLDASLYEISTPNKNEILFSINYPRLGSAYRIDWDW
jgi:hypothetical protein